MRASSAWWCWVRNQAPKKPLLAPAWQATRTLSRAESSRKSRMFWKVRATPRPQIWWALSPLTRCPPTSTSPSVGT